MSASQRIEARAFQPGDERILLEGMARAARSAGGGPGRELAELAWRYGAAPHGACLALALDEDGSARAGIAATRQRVLFQGGEVHWLQVGDLFHDFSQGAGLARARALRMVGEAFAESFGGFAPERHPVMYGLPDRRAHRFGLRVLEWEVLRSENELFLPLGPQADPVGGERLELEEPALFPEDVRLVFDACAAGRQALLVKDAAYLNWRHVRRPGAAQERVLARRGGVPVGFAVLDGSLLLDWGARPEDEGAVLGLLAWARARARAGGQRELRAVFPDSAPEWMAFQRLGFRVRGTREYLCFRSFQRPAIMSWLYQHWSYARGDTLR